MNGIIWQEWRAEELTQFSATAFILHNVAMVDRFEDFNLLHPRVMEVIASFLLEGFHCHILSSAIVSGVIHIQHHFPKMALKKEKKKGNAE